MLDVKKILNHIPHRYPFLLVDRIVEIHGDEKIVGIKNVSINENFSFWKMQGVATVDQKLVAQAEISAMEVEIV